MTLRVEEVKNPQHNAMKEKNNPFTEEEQQQSSASKKRSFSLLENLLGQTYAEAKVQK